MLQGGEDTVLIHRAGDIVGLLLDGVVSGAHGHPDPGVAEHGKIVLSVTKGHGLLQGDMEIVQDGVHAEVLAAGGGDYVQETGVPAGGFQVGSPVQQQMLVVPVQKGQGLIQLPVQRPGGVADRGKRQIQLPH